MNGAGIADIGEIGLLIPDDPDFEAARSAAKLRKVQAHAIRTRTRRQQRRAKSEAELSQLLPPRIDPGDTWHVVSGGDIDALSYLSHVLRGMRADYALLSTWCMALDDVKALGAWLQSGVIRRLDCYVGEIFPSQYPAAHDALCAVVREAGGRVAVFRNHSKVMLAGNASTGEAFVIESSANVNTNPRTEQTVVTNDRDLFGFYKNFYDGIHSYNRNFDDWQPHGTPSQTDSPESGRRQCGEARVEQERAGPGLSE